MISSPSLLLLLLLLANAVVVVSSLEVGDVICAEGFVMDTYCINRGTLLDNPKVESLKGPEQHTVHCLVDIHSCYTSPFEILVAPTNNTTKYSRGWRLNDAGREAMVTLGRSVGSCSTCSSPTVGLEKGFRAAVKAEVLSLNLDDDLLVPELKLLEDPIFTADGSNIDDNICQNNYNLPNILNILTSAEKDLLFTTRTDASFRNLRLAHGSLMLIGWGLILPSGVIVARFLKHRPDGLWFKLHARVFQPIGLGLTIIGWILALVNFNVFGNTDIRFIHGLVGSIVMVLGLLQPLNAFFRPHLVEGEEKIKKRILWEHYHRGAGWSCVFLAAFVVIVGTTMLPQPSDQMTFQITYAVGCIGVLVVLLGYLKLDQRKEQYAKGGEEEEEEDVKKEDVEVEDAEEEIMDA